MSVALPFKLQSHPVVTLSVKRRDNPPPPKKKPQRQLVRLLRKFIYYNHFQVVAKKRETEYEMCQLL